MPELVVKQKRGRPQKEDTTVGEPESKRSG
jgi:hypothetical protein